MKNLKIKQILQILIVGFCFSLYGNKLNAQVEDSSVVEGPVTTNETVDDDEGKLPVRNPWTTGMLIDHQTTEGQNAGTFEFAIHHRFGKIFDMKDLFGIYAASNIRLGLTYGVTKDISIGFGTEKNNKMQEFTGKYKILSQTRDGKMPVSVTYFGNIVIDAREKEIFGANYEFKNRLSFFNQIAVSRKLTNAASLQVAGNYSHFNAVTDLTENSRGQTIGKWKNDYIGIMAGGRYKVYNNLAIIAEYSYPIALDKAWEGQSEPKPNLGFGVELGTSTHAFQIFVANYEGIVAQQNYAHNTNDMGGGGWHFGFNITVRL